MQGATATTPNTATHARMTSINRKRTDDWPAPTIEGFWSQMKRSIDGTHHHVSPKWLHRYAAEHAWRYSRRRSARPLLLMLLDRAAAVPRAKAA